MPGVSGGDDLDGGTLPLSLRVDFYTNGVCRLKVDEPPPAVQRWEVRGYLRNYTPKTRLVPVAEYWLEDVFYPPPLRYAFHFPGIIAFDVRPGSSPINIDGVEMMGYLPLAAAWKIFIQYRKLASSLGKPL